MAETTGLLNLHTGNRITSSNLVLSAQRNQQKVPHESAAFFVFWRSLARACSWRATHKHKKHRFPMHLFADCSRTVREMRRRPAPEQISSGRPPYEIPPTRARASQLRSLRNTHQRRTSSSVAGMRLVLQDIRNRSAYGIQADAVILDIHRFLRSPKVIQQQIEFLPGLRKDA